ncbi:hypothetical protein HYT02_05785 [Candidatus Gottesmanbacteria bacterium]|nr:hypothetical protein [Candidatus Gottesmanbacteria bacterium]
MINPERSALTSEEQLSANFIIDRTTQLDRLYTQRMIIDSANIPWRVANIGGRERIDPLLKFLKLTTQGIALTLRASETAGVGVPALRGLVGDIASDEENEMDAIWQSIKSSGISVDESPKGLALPNDRHFLTVSRHTLATLSHLRDLGDVSFERLGIKDRVSDIPTYWPRKMTVCDTIKMLTEIETTTGRMLVEDDPPIDGETAFRAAHFLAMSSLNAQIVLNQQAVKKERKLNIRML